MYEWLSIHFYLVNVGVFEWLYLVQYWPNKHHHFLTLWVSYCLFHNERTHNQAPLGLILGSDITFQNNSSDAFSSFPCMLI